MKKIVYHIIIIIAILAAACTDDPFLEPVPYSFTSPENFYQKESDFELAINGCYDILNSGSVQGLGNHDTWSRGLYFMMNGGTDEMITQASAGGVDYAPWGLAAFTSDNKFLRYNWHFFYAGINRTNYLLEKIDNVEFRNNLRKEEIKAEAVFLRGLYHYYLSMLFGAIPTYTTSSQDPSAERQPVNEVFSRIIQDFTYGYNNLQHRASILGRANKWSAAGFLAKTYTYLASCKTNNVGESLNFPLNSFSWVDAGQTYTNALTLLNDIVLNSGYELIPNYDYLFRETTKSHQYKECLFLAEACGEPGNQKINIWVNNLLPQGNANIHGGGYGWQRPLGEVFHRYNVADKRRHHNCTGNFSGSIEVEVIDGVRYYIPRPITHANTGWYSGGKFRYRDPQQKNLLPWATDGNFPLLRFADLLLLQAEALFFTGNETQARNVLTTIRQRSAQGDVQVLNTAYYKADFVQELLDERSRELCFEGHRRIDLRRFGKYTQVIGNLSALATTGFYNTAVPTLKANWQEYKIWFPIPVSETDINPNLVQNPGWVAE